MNLGGFMRTLRDHKTETDTALLHVCDALHRPGTLLARRTSLNVPLELARATIQNASFQKMHVKLTQVVLSYY